MTQPSAARRPDLVAWPVPPRPLASAPRTPRQRAILDALEELVLAEGFAHLKLTGIAARLNVSPTTLYTLAANKDDLILLVVDRWYQHSGDRALKGFAAATTAAEKLEVWLAGAVRGVQGVSTEYLRDCSTHSAVKVLADTYRRYYVAVLEHLLALGVADGSLVCESPRIAAQVMDACLVHMADPEVIAALGCSEEEAIAVTQQVVMRGLLPRKAARR